MTYSEFCNIFYATSKKKAALKGVSAQPDIAEFFIRTALDKEADKLLAFSENSFRKWFTGDRHPSKELWEAVDDNFDKKNFLEVIAFKLHDTVLRGVLGKSGVEIGDKEIPDKYAFANAVTMQFKSIVEGNGEGENVLVEAYFKFTSTNEFPDYIRKSHEKYSKMKTLLYTYEEKNFDDFFVCNSICKDIRKAGFAHRRSRIKDDEIINNATLDDLAQKSNFVLLIGMGGIGKSMMMRHLFLESIKQVGKTNVYPIIITLREFGSEINSLFDLVVESAHRFDVTISSSHLHKMLLEGRCQLLLDGFDEVRQSDMESFQRQLDAIIDKYPLNQYVMSSRRFSSFVGLSRFVSMAIMPFNHKQAIELIDKLEFCPEEPKLKQKFREHLINRLFETHEEFVTNPLLLTLMLMNYHRYSDVPERKYLFYEQAYETLLQRHDADKLAYKRIFHSVNDPSDFTKVFREFCAKSYRKGDYEFSESKFGEYFDKLKSVERINLPLMKVENFLFDACNSACLMYEEGQSYHFLHRSFQEYFFADYYSRQNDSVLRKLGEYIRKAKPMKFDDGSALDMLYDLAPDKVEQFIFIPFLEEIFEIDNEDDSYWKFLKYGYDTWEYSLFDCDKLKSHGKPIEYMGATDFNPPSSNIFSLICRVRKLQAEIFMKVNDARLAKTNLINGIIWGEKFCNNREVYDTPMHLVWVSKDTTMDMVEKRSRRCNVAIILDDEKKPVEFGYHYCFDFDLAITEPEEYKDVLSHWERESCLAYKNYQNIKSYYYALKEAYSDFDNDDDF